MNLTGEVVVVNLCKKSVFDVTSVELSAELTVDVDVNGTDVEEVWKIVGFNVDVMGFNVEVIICLTVVVLLTEDDVLVGISLVDFFSSFSFAKNDDETFEMEN